LRFAPCENAALQPLTEPPGAPCNGAHSGVVFGGSFKKTLSADTFLSFYEFKPSTFPIIVL
jgi:hypothetical protein